MSQGIVRRIFSLARRLEPDRQAIWDWLYHTQIDTLGGLTPMELIFIDRGEQVIALLERALGDEEAGAAATATQRLLRAYRIELIH
jgi:hypothetical protein